MPLSNVGILRLQLLKEGKLVQPLQAQLPQTLVVLLAFFEGQLPADDLVARGRVPLKFNPAYVKLLAFVYFDVPRDRLFAFVEIGCRQRVLVVDAWCPLTGLQAFKPFRELLPRKNLAVFDLKHPTKRFAIWNRFVASKGYRREPVLIAFLNRHCD